MGLEFFFQTWEGFEQVRILFILTVISQNMSGGRNLILDWEGFEQIRILFILRVISQKMSGGRNLILEGIHKATIKATILVFEKFELRKQKIFYLLNRA